MTATITACHVLKSINKTMTVVRVTDAKGEFASARVVYADSFGEVTMKRTFRTWTDVEVFVENELRLDRPATHGTLDQIVEQPTPVAKSLHGAELRQVAHAYADAMGFTGQGRTSCVDGFLDGYAMHPPVKGRRLYGDAYRVGYAKGLEG